MRHVLLGLSLTLALPLACGDDGGGGGGADAGDDVDSGTSDAGPTTTACGLQLTFTNPSRRVGAPVLFSTPDGVVLGTDVTDVDGVASFDACVPGTLITFDLAATPGSGPGGYQFFDLVTVTAVQPGDTVVFPVPSQESEPFDATVPINISSDASGIAHDSVGYNTGCQSSSGSLLGASVNTSVPYTYCLGSDQTIDVMTTLSQGDDLVGVSYATGVAVTAGQTSPTVELPAFTNVSAATDLGVSVSNVVAGAEVDISSQQFRDSRQFYGRSLYAIPLTNGAGSTTLDLLPAEFMDAMSLYVEAELYHGDGLYSGTSVDTRGDRATSAEVDFNDLLPVLRGASVSFADGNVSVDWQADGSLAEADMIGAYVRFFGPSMEGYWTVLFPGQSGTSFTVTALPKALELIISDAYVDGIAAWELDWTDYPTAINSGINYGLGGTDEGAPLQRQQRTTYYGYD
jgi:hypothetical protein